MTTSNRKPMKKILMLFCGGTISMHKNPETGSLEVANSPEQLFQLEPRIRELADISVELIDNIDSTNMTHKHWERMVEAIARNYDDYDGFILTTGTNTMAYASSALSFALEDLGKPVVLTGAQIPAESVATDARNNLANAFRVATMDIGGVFVVFGTKIIVGSRAKKVSESDLDAFKSFNASDFGEIGVAIKIGLKGFEKHDRPLQVKNGFDDNVVCLTCVPGLKPDYLVNLIDQGVRGLILRAYGSGDMPYDFIPALEYARGREVPVVVTTQCPGGATLMGMNDVGLKALNTGVIQAFDMCMEAMSTKLMWLLAQKTPYEEIRRLMGVNLRGEVSSQTGRLVMDSH